MKCPFCNHLESKVTDSRNTHTMDAVRRRRECIQCMRRFTTFETVELSLQVKKRDGTYEDFQQEKLLGGINAACRHTRVSRDQVLTLTHKIKADLVAHGVCEITTKELGERVMSRLQELDVVAYIRFACVYKRFKDIKELIEAIRSIAPGQDAPGSKSELEQEDIQDAAKQK